MNISIIIPNYNGEKLLSKNLPKVIEAVKDYKEGKIDIIIPDDPSTDNSKKIIDEFIANIKEKHIIGKTVENRDPKQAGFSRNVNRGVQIAEGEVLILFNSDVFPHSGFLDPLLSHFKNPKIFAVGCLDESLEKGKIVFRGRGLGKWQRGFLVHRAGDVDKKNTLWVSGGSGAFRKSIWDELHGLDSLYDPFYWEDIDISYNAQKAGYLVAFEPESIVTHEHETGVVKGEFSSEYVKKIAYRNQFIFVWKNITDYSLLINHIFWLPYHFVKIIFIGESAFVQGFILALFKMPLILKKRFESGKLIHVQDKDVIKSVID